MQRKTLTTWMKRISIAFAMVLAIYVVNTYAQGLAIPTGGAHISPDIVQNDTFGGVIIRMVNYFIGFLGFLAVLSFVYAGVLWVVSGGSEEMISKSKTIMTYSALGLVVVLLSYSIVTFITSSAGGKQTVKACKENTDCAADELCVNLFCKSSLAVSTNQGCGVTRDCGAGEYCSVESAASSGGGTCVPGVDVTCESSADCQLPKECDPFGLCRNPDAGSGSTCQDNTDCYSGYVCNQDSNVCQVQGSGLGAGAVSGGVTSAAADQSLTAIDGLVKGMLTNLGNLSADLEKLKDADKANILNVLNSGGPLADKIDQLKTLSDSTTDPEVLKVLESLVDGLNQLSLTREELDSLRATMPESEATIAAYDEASKSLDELVDDPKSSIRLRRFEKNYTDLKDLIRKFPIVESRIRALPGAGNVPFTVTFDGLGSIDPTGGTISDYKWSYIDAEGNQVSLGNSPVITHEFTEPNTYAIKLTVSTSQKDDAGFKTAMDGVSTVRIQANLPASHVDFRVDGTQVQDIYHATLKEGGIGISFDPSMTTPMLGRTIAKYSWSYGDSAVEERTTPATVVHVYKEAGEYQVTLKVTDNLGVQDRKTIKVFVKSLAADINVTPLEGNVNTDFHFVGVNSRSDDGSINDYEWEINDKEGNAVVTSELENFYHTFDRPGSYVVNLLVTDSTGAKDKRLATVKVFSRSPIASFVQSFPETNHPNRAEFSAVNSYDPDEGDHITYSWDFDGDGSFELVETSDIQVTYDYKKTGDFKAVLQVQDSFGQRDSIEKNIHIDSVLSGDIDLEKHVARVGEEVTFKAVSPNAVGYLWEFGDGQTTSTAEDTVTYTYTKSGKYKVKLNFFDADDNDNSDTATLLVGSSDSPIAYAGVTLGGRSQAVQDNLCGQGKDGYIVNRADSLNLTARDSVNTDGSSRLLSYSWQFSDGSRSDQKDLTHKFTEINKEGECTKVNLAVRDQISGKVSDDDILYFKVINELPTLIDFVITGGQAGALVTPAKVHLRAVAPKDPDGQVKKFRWWYYPEGQEDAKLGVHSTSELETDMTITAQGESEVTNTYYFVLEMTDNDGGVYNTIERFGDLSSLSITNGPNLSPVADFTMDKTTISVGDSITFVSSAYDPQGDALPNDAFRWDFDGDGSFDDTSSGAQVNRQYNTPGEYEVRLRVVYRGLSTSASKTIFVEPTQSLPQAAFTYTVDGNDVKFDSSNSRYDADLEDITLRYEWDFDIATDANGNGINDDDIESTEPNPSFGYGSLGLYRARLKVKDSLGMEGVVVRDVNLAVSAQDREKATFRSVDVSSPSQPLTLLNIAVSPGQVAKGDTADVTVTVQNADNSQYYGNVFFEVLDGGGSFNPNPVPAKDNKATSIFSAGEAGSVRIRVRATETYFGDISEEAIVEVR